MKQPKYNIGDKVWWISSYELVSKTITGIFLLKGPNWRNDQIRYTFDYQNDFPDIVESRVFPTKEELIASL